jgi:hypothetical protein
VPGVTAVEESSEQGHMASVAVRQLTPLSRDDGGCYSSLLKYGRQLSLAEVLRIVRTAADGGVIFIVRVLTTQWGEVHVCLVNVYHCCVVSCR